MSSKSARRRRRQERILAAGEKGDGKFAIISPVEIKAIANEEGNPKKPATFEILAYNGGELKTEQYIRKFGMPVVIDLQGLSYSPSITANMDHDASQRVGHVTEKTNDGKQLILAGVVSGTGTAAQEVVDNAKNDYPWKASVEALPTTSLEAIKAGQTVSVNGQTFTGPILVARKSRLYGVAFVARGADETTTVKIAATAVITKEIDMKFGEWIIAMGFDPEVLTDVQTAALQKKFDAEQKVTPITAAPAFDLDGLRVAYAVFETTIEATAFEWAGKVETVKLGEIKATAMKAGLDLKKKALDEEWAPTRFEIEAIKADYAFKADCLESSRAVAPAIHSGGSGEMKPLAIEAALSRCLGIDVEDKSHGYNDETLQHAHTNHQNLGLQETFIICAQANGYQGRSRIGTDNIREVLAFALPPAVAIHGSSFSTSSLSGMLSNVANKMLLSGFTEDDDTWRKVCEVKPVSDFKDVTSYRMLDEMEYEELGPNGEIAHGKLGEESFTRSADTYAKMFALTRTQIINDDLGALDDLRTRLGRGAARRFRRLFWSKFLDNGSFFTAARGNYLSGATSTLLTDGVGLQLGITLYRKMKSTDKKQVGKPKGKTTGGSIGTPQLLVCPPELQFVAEKLHVSANLSTQQDDNIHRGKYEPLVINELSDSDYSGYSVKEWYLFGGVLKPVVVSFLNGNQNPTVSSADADFNQLGVQFRGYHDFGVDLAEWLAGIKSKAAA